MWIYGISILNTIQSAPLEGKGRVGPARTPEARRTAGKQKRRGQPRRRGTCRE